jgi:hypothetical protein
LVAARMEKKRGIAGDIKSATLSQVTRLDDVRIE